MKFLRLATAVLCMVFAANVAWAQRVATGVVKDRHGEPLIGANVYVKGTTVSTISGINGEFRIPADTSAVLLITFLGYQDLEVKVSELATANLQLKPAKQEVRFYGNDSYHAITAAKTLVESKDIGTGLETEVYHYLLGKVPGLEVVSDGGNPWGLYNFRLRGYENENGPLFVVDGMYFDGEMFSGDIVSALNPSDIESIMVLKDAAATAQYGPAGANGVVVIKTRGNTSQTLDITYDGNVSVNLGPDDFYLTDISNYIDSSGNSYQAARYADYEDFSISTKHNVGVSGMGGPVAYRASVGVNSIGGIEEYTKSNRYSANVWAGTKLLDNHINIDFNGYSRYRNNMMNEHSDDDISSLAALLRTDYSVHSLEAIHLNLTAGLSHDGVETTGDYGGSADNAKLNRVMLDANLNLNHEFGKKYYLEFMAGAKLSNSKLDAHGIKEHVSSFYGKFNVALNRFFMNVDARYNTYKDIYKSYDFKHSDVSASLSLSVKPANIMTMRTGVGIIGMAVGDTEYDVNKFKAFTYNLGVDFGTAKSRVYSSADFFLQYNGIRNTSFFDEDQVSIGNVGGEFSIGAKLINADRVKWRFGANMAYISSFAANSSDYSYYDDLYALTDFRQRAYRVYEPAYADGNVVPGLWVDRNKEYGIIDDRDRITTDYSPMPTFVAGFNTYFEAMDVYLQIDTHANADRFNIVDNRDYIGERDYTLADIHNSSFLRIDDIVLGYKFKNLWKFTGRVYAAAQNPFVITKYNGIDPEIYNGLDTHSFYQRPTTFTVGVKLNINTKD